MGDEHDRHELGEVLALLAHDLKNPLAAVLTNLGFVGGVLEDLAGEGETDRAVSDARDAIADARLASETIQRFVSNLDLLARDSTGRASLVSTEPTPLDLHGVVDEAIGRHLEPARGRRIRLQARVRTPACYASADRDQVLRAMENLLANAVQHAPLGTEVIVDVGFGVGAREATIAVLDRGPIVPTAMRAEVLQLGGQLQSKGRPELRYGRGLSRLAAHLAARLAGGRIEVGESEGRSSLSLVLPRHIDEEQAPARSAAPKTPRRRNA